MAGNKIFRGILEWWEGPKVEENNLSPRALPYVTQQGRVVSIHVDPGTPMQERNDLLYIGNALALRFGQGDLHFRIVEGRDDGN